MHTIKAMDAASGELADLDGLSVAELKALLREQHTALQEKHAQLVAKDALLRSYTFEIEALKLQILSVPRKELLSRGNYALQKMREGPSESA